MTKIGYARISTADQDLQVQVERLGEAGCHVIRKEIGSGSSRNGRDELETIMAFLQPGDELVVHRLDRLGRSTRDVLNLVHELEGKGAFLRVLEPDVSTAGDLGRLVVTVLGMVADLELKFIRDRQKAGIAAARKRGVYKGRPASIDMAEVRRLASLGISKTEVARQMKISRQSVYRALASDMDRQSATMTGS